MQTEIWKEVIGYEGLYQVSNLGRVKSLGNGGGNRSKEKILKQSIEKPRHKGSTTSYNKVGLCKNGKQKRYLIHRLVAENFINNLDNKPQVNHKDGNGLNNHIENLEWCTPSENQIHCYEKLGRIPTIYWKGKERERGGKNWLSKKVMQYNLEGDIIKIWDCINDIQRELNIQNQNIVKVCQGKRKTAGGFKWKYV